VATSVVPLTRPTYGEFGKCKLEGLVRGLGLEHRLAVATDLLELLTSSWCGLPMDGKPLWPSDITDDGTPFELSVAFPGGEPLVRVLAEAQHAPFDIVSNWDAGLALTRELRLRAGVDLGRFERISALFAPPPGSSARFAIWHAGTVEADGNLSFKLYLNPLILGSSLAPELVRQALTRLDAEYAWEEIARKLTPNSELLYFSLDLATSADARVKVYLAHRDSTSAQVDRLVQDESGYAPGVARSWIDELTGWQGRFDARPLLTCHAFRSPMHAAEVTIHVPTRCYVEHDAESLLRAGGLLGPQARTLRAAVEAMARRPLEVGRGLVTYVSLRPAAGGLRLTTYLAPEAYAISAARPTSLAPAPTLRPTMAPNANNWPSAPPPLESAVRALRADVTTFEVVEAAIAERREVLSSHAFLTRLERGGTIDEVRGLASQLTFYVMCFQDMLRLARGLTTDPVLKDFAIKHEAEDLGHDQWFLSDLALLGVGRNLSWTFSAAHENTRDVAYHLIAEIVGAEHDATRLAVLLSLEAAGAEFFGRIIGLLDRLGRSEGLLYFARTHHAIEQNHDVFEQESKRRLDAIVLPDDALSEVLRAVTCTFETMTRFADELAKAMDASDPEVGYERAQGMRATG
jgi:DMATS type aromatic prenyltransferase